MLVVRHFPFWLACLSSRRLRRRRHYARHFPPFKLMDIGIDSTAPFWCSKILRVVDALLGRLYDDDDDDDDGVCVSSFLVFQTSQTTTHLLRLPAIRYFSSLLYSFHFFFFGFFFGFLNDQIPMGCTCIYIPPVSCGLLGRATIFENRILLSFS